MKRFLLAMLLAAAGIIMLMEFALDLKVGFLLWMRADLCFIDMDGNGRLGGE